MAQLSRSALQVDFASGTFATEEKFVTLASSFFNFTDDTFSLLETPDTVEITHVTLPEASVMAQSASASYWQFFTGDKANRQEFYVWYNSGTAVDPTASGTGIEVTTDVDDLVATVATNTAAAIGFAGGFASAFVTVAASAGTIDLTTLHTGSVADAVDGNQPMGSGFSISITQDGSDGGVRIWNTVASGHLIPVTGSAQDIGSSALPIRSLYMAGSSLFIDAKRTLFASGAAIHLAGGASSMTISALDVNVIADQNVSLTASVLLALKGSALTLDSSTDITISASQLVDISASTVNVSATNLTTIFGSAVTIQVADSSGTISLFGPIRLADITGVLATDITAQGLQITSSANIILNAVDVISLTGSTINIVGGSAASAINIRSASGVLGGDINILAASGGTAGGNVNIQAGTTISGEGPFAFINLIGPRGGVNGGGIRASSETGIIQLAALNITASAGQTVTLSASGLFNINASRLDMSATGGINIAVSDLSVSARGVFDLFASDITIESFDSAGVLNLFVDEWRVHGGAGGGARASGSVSNVLITTHGITLNSSTAITLNASTNIIIDASQLLDLRGSIVTINGTKAQVIGTDYSASVAPGAVGHERIVEMPDGNEFVDAAAPAQYWQISTSGTDYYVWYAAGVSTDPVPAGRTGIQVTASTIDNSAAVASNTQVAIDAVAAFNASVSGVNDSFVIVTNVSTTLPGSVAVDVTASVAFSGVITGSAGDVFETGFKFAATAAGKTYLQVYNNGVKQMEGTTKNWTQSDASTITFTASGVPLSNDDIEFYGFGV